jgi:hypothetical protein
MHVHRFGREAKVVYSALQARRPYASSTAEATLGPSLEAMSKL